MLAIARLRFVVGESEHAICTSPMVMEAADLGVFVTIVERIVIEDIGHLNRATLAEMSF